MPGVRAILRASELPAPADVVTDLGERIPANPKGEPSAQRRARLCGRASPGGGGCRRGDGGAAIEAIEIDFEPLPLWSIRS